MLIDSMGGEYLDKGFNERVTYKVRTDLTAFETLKNTKGVLVIEL